MAASHNRSLGKKRMFREFSQDLAYPGYDGDVGPVGYPPSIHVSELPTLYTENHLYDPPIQHPQSGGYAHTGPVGIESYQPNYCPPNYPSLSPCRSMEFDATNSSTSGGISSHFLPYMASADFMGQVSNDTQVLQRQASTRSLSTIGSSDVRAAFIPCQWGNCHQVFSSKGSVMRHLSTMHVDPKSFKCPHRDCNRAFNRKDNRDDHSRRAHRVVGKDPFLIV